MQPVNLKNRHITLHGKKYAVLAGKPTPIPNRSIYLLSALGEEQDHSLWLVEPSDDDDNKIDLWPYEGTDTKELIIELMEKFIETAFDKDE